MSDEPEPISDQSTSAGLSTVAWTPGFERVDSPNMYQTAQLTVDKQFGDVEIEEAQDRDFPRPSERFGEETEREIERQARSREALNLLNRPERPRPTDLDEIEKRTVEEVVKAAKEFGNAGQNESLEDYIARQQDARQRLDAALGCVSPERIDSIFAEANSILKNDRVRLERNPYTNEIIVGNSDVPGGRVYLHSINPAPRNCVQSAI